MSTSQNHPLGETTLANNKKAWSTPGSDTFRGEGWSNAFGGSDSQWWTTIFPRIRKYINSHCIVEIACGWGRWSRFLNNTCNKFVGYDINDTGIKNCEQQFYFDILNKKAFFYLNDGKTLTHTEDNSVDFIFSYDSLVHSQLDVIESYIKEAKRTLKPGGTMFLHHSNLQNCNTSNNKHWRSPDVGFELVNNLTKANNLSIISQEMFSYDTTNDSKSLHDCFTVVRNSPQANETIFFNLNYNDEMTNCKRIAQTYS